MKRIISLFLAAVMLFACLTACNDNPDINLTPSDENTVIAYKDLAITQGIFDYELSFQKANFLYNYFGTLNEDVPELWAEDAEGEEFGKYFLDMVEDNCKKMLYYANYALEQGYELSDEDIDIIEQGQDALIERFGSKEAYEEFLAEYGVSYDEIYEYSKLGMLYSAGYDMTFGDKAPEMITDEELYTYYTENFATTKHVYINNYYTEDENGEVVEISESEAAQKTALMDTVEELARAEGADFEALVEQYNEDENSNVWSNGFTFTTGTFGLAEYEDQTLYDAMQIGEIKRFEIDGIGIFLVKRYDLSEDMFSYFSANIENILIDQKADAAIDGAKDDFIINEEKLSAISVADAKVFDLDRYYAMSEGV